MAIEASDPVLEHDTQLPQAVRLPHCLSYILNSMHIIEDLETSSPSEWAEQRRVSIKMACGELSCTAACEIVHVTGEKATVGPLISPNGIHSLGECQF